ncbi:MAG: MBL fold metallo-hydrolase [Flavobacteriaceae bacterium]
MRLKKCLLISALAFFSLQPGRSQTYLKVLGTVQDAGAPHMGCEKSCCVDLFSKPQVNLMVSSLGLVDGNQTYVFDATPDFPAQSFNLLSEVDNGKNTPDGVFISHAHIGHYTGLMYLGREALGGNAVPVYVMPKMEEFIRTNGPWEQLVDLNNISLIPIKNKEVQLSSDVKVEVLVVPHRDEYSETIGFLIEGPSKRVLFIPDINKWSSWKQDIKAWIKKVDYAFLDATFYDQNEIPHRDMSEVPHPFVVESMELFKDLNQQDKDKVYFIHLNHSNPLLNVNSEAYETVKAEGFHVARYNQKINL